MAIELKLSKGQIFGRLTVIKEGVKIILPSGQTNRTINCICECGNIKDIRLSHLVRGRISSCGCLSKTKKGMSGTKLYRVLKSMKERCYNTYGNQSKTNVKNYLHKGITVCFQWQNDYVSFINWALENGYKEGLQIDRIDNSKGYYPENCRWVTSEVNGNNKDNTFIVNYNGNKEPFLPLIRSLGLINNASAIRTRIKRGWEHQKAIDTPVKKGNYFKKY